MAFVSLDDDEALKGHVHFHMRFNQEGFGSVPDLTLREFPPPYVEDPKPEQGAAENGPKNEELLGYVTGWKLVGMIMSITMACFLVLLDMSVIVTAIPEITTYFHSLPDVGWYGSAYNLASAALQPLSGKFYTYFNTKWTFLGFLLLFLLGSLVCGLATSSTMFIVGRAIAGLGSAGLQNGAMTIIVAAAPLGRRPALMGMSMGGCQMGLAAGPLVGGALTQYTTWPQKVGYYLPFSIVSAAILAIGYGLMTTFSPETETAKWVVYQTIVGVGRGLGMQIALIAIQANTAPDFIAIATATLVFCQTFGGAIFIAVANSIFNNTLKNELTDRVPAMDAQVIVDAGATGLRAVAEGGDVTGVLMSYSKGVDAVFYVVIATSLCIPRNRQQRDAPGKHTSSPATPQQAAGTVPTAQQVVPGAGVFIVLKEDQPSGRQTPGTVQSVLTRGNHPRGIKVRLRGGMVGRVQRMSGEAGTEAAEAVAAAVGVGTGNVPASSSRPLCRDIRLLDGLGGYPDEPPERTLADFMPVVDNGLQSSPHDDHGTGSQGTVTCPVCEAFQGDEAAVTHHIERDHFS
ncbi:major facilitator superfamily protein [Hirsutella rhossiliensis]|uniref:Major facilitator superfamily domain-containing protein n=1 Tax=Hirsutella rhossiliensis TaxID=111463 RepID=A0A9P8MYU2_9HYPO|nr:major facilitator superfamily domain-containing protein [Hirsutella rhossiliensis]KAH0963487.1 major facilitator superfamily domain-containing protein [Hirsutella rhossiliensis]